MKRGFIFLAFLLTELFLIVSPVLAQGFFNINDPTVLAFLKDVLKLPPEWTQPSQFLFNFILPFVALFAIILGMMRAIGVFRTQTSVQMVIAFVMAFLTIPSGFLVTFVQWTLAVAGGVVYALFLFLLLGGAYWYSRGFVWAKEGTARRAQSFARNMKGIDRELSEYQKEKIILEGELSNLMVEKRELDPDDRHYDEKFADIEGRISATKTRLDHVQENLEKTRQKITSMRRSY